MLQPLWYLLMSFAFVACGSLMIFSITHTWGNGRRLASLLVCESLLVYVALQYFANDLSTTGTIFLIFGGLMLMAHTWDILHVVPEGLERATEEQNTVYGYEIAGKLGLWTVIM